MNKVFNNHSDEISFKEISNKIKDNFFFLLSQWWKIIILSFVGGLCAYGFAYLTPITYNAKITFVVEEGKSNGGGLSSLVGQFGLDIGSSGGNGLLYGDNLLLFLKSQNLSREVLLSPYDSASNYSLADKYADQYGLRAKWEKNKKIGKIYFPPIHTHPFSRLQDSLIQGIITQVLKKELLIDRPEKKATFVSVECIMKDELLSKYYCERLVQQAADRYIRSKTRRQKSNVDRLQLRADSIAAVLNNKTFLSASDQEKILDLNLSAKTSAVKAEVSTRDKIMIATIYGEVVKNLEISKVQLSQETPSIQVVDTVNLPLNTVRTSKTVYTLIGLVLGAFLMTSFLLAKRFLSY